MTDPAITVNEQAADWVARMHSDQRTRADVAAFRAWVEESDAHREAYLDHAALWAGMGLLADNAEVSAALLPEGTRLAPRRANRRAVMFGGVGAVAAAAVVAVLAGPALMAERYRTEPGEQRRIALADGSMVLLNTDSALRVKLGRNERRLFLDKGQAFFQVAKDKTRPFRVFVGEDEVRAVGTAFDVRKVGDGARVTLEEGRVAIYKSGARVGTAGPKSIAAVKAKPVAVLSAGQQAMLAPVESPVVQSVDLRKSQAWRVGRLVLEDSSLAEAAAELNRYGAPHIVLADRGLEQLRVSGVFHTGEPDAFVESLTTAYPVRIVRRDAEEIVLAERAR